jgi:integrase
LAFGEAWPDFDVVCDRGDGHPIRPNTLSRNFGRISNEAGVPGARFHDLRHAYATMLLAAGTHPKVASDALGHASAAFTMNVYQHLLPSLAEQAAEAVQAALGDALG